MKWETRRRSTNVEDRRGMGRGPVIGGGLGIGAVVLALIIFLMGGDPTQILSNLGPADTGAVTSYSATPEEDELAQFVSVVLADTEDIWTEQFKADGREYIAPKLVLFTGSVDSACGVAGSSTGPFYCPGDQKVYIDLSFYQDLSEQLQAPGDFAMAYVIAHEVGHHIQNQLGITDQVMAMQNKVSETEFKTEYLVRLELQADYLAGVWAHHSQETGWLEAGDIEEALTAAAAVGDDRIQKSTQGYVVPDSFTHGTSEQRVRWFTKGFESGDMNGGDTFNTNDL